MNSVTAALYLAFKPMLKALCARLGSTGTSLPFRAFAFVHNALLCAYSTWTAVNVVPLTVNHIRDHGPLDAYCRHDLWESGLGYWGFLFYLSKTWELIDTLLLVVKRKQPSYLQVYHHAMTILCAYWLQVSHAPVQFLFVGLNSTVHSVMYFYYACSVLKIRLPGKSFITTGQIIQFIVGIFLTGPMFLLEDGNCATPAQKFAVAAIVAHAAYLIKLFNEFYEQSYRKKQLASQ